PRERTISGLVRAGRNGLGAAHLLDGRRPPPRLRRSLHAAAAGHPVSAVRGWAERIRGAAEPTYRGVIADPVREGRMKVDGLNGPTWVIATVGLIVLAALTVSILLAERYRAGLLVDIGIGGQGTFLPASAMPVVLVAMGLGAVMLLVGASQARWPVRI